MFAFRGNLMVIALSALLATPAFAEDLQALPMGTACEDPAANYVAEVGMMQSVALPVKLLKSSAKEPELEFKVVLDGRFAPGYPIFRVGGDDANAATLKAAAKYGTKNAAWVVVMLYNAIGKTLDPETSDYQYGVFVETGNGKKGCAEVFDTLTPRIMGHADLSVQLLALP